MLAFKGKEQRSQKNTDLHPISQHLPLNKI